MRKHCVMKTGKRALLSVGLWLIMAATSIADVVPTTADSGKFFDPQHQRPMSSQYEDSVAKLVGAPGDFKIDLIKAGKRPHTIALPDAIVQVNSIEWPSKKRIAVIGMVNGSGFMVAVIDVAQARVADTFFGDEVTLSPNKAFAVFIKYFPPHGVDNPEDRIRMYNFARSAAQNRPAKSSYPPEFEDGVPVYPVLSTDEEAARQNIEVPDTDAYRIASTFKWSDDSARVLFVMLHGEHELALVSATPSGQVAVADLSPSCGTHCGSVHASNIAFVKDGVGLDLLGTGSAVGKNKHVIVREEEFSAITRR